MREWRICAICVIQFFWLDMTNRATKFTYNFISLIHLTYVFIHQTKVITSIWISGEPRQSSVVCFMYTSQEIPPPSVPLCSLYRQHTTDEDTKPDTFLSTFHFIYYRMSRENALYRNTMLQCRHKTRWFIGHKEMKRWHEVEILKETVGRLGQPNMCLLYKSIFNRRGEMEELKKCHKIS